MTESIQHNHKDNLFRAVFGRDKANALALYNAINETNYDNPEDLEFNSLEKLVFLGMKNDISFVIDSELQLYEHQSTYSENMPLRGLFYLSDLIRQKILPKEDENEDEEVIRKKVSAKLYQKKRIVLPTPKVVVFYNGKDETPDRFALSLRDSFANPEESCVDLTVEVINVNPNHNTELFERCLPLRQYMTFLEQTKLYKSQGYALKTAALKATNDIIEENIGLSSLFRKIQNEVIDLYLEDYDEQAVREVLTNDALNEKDVTLIKRFSSLGEQPQRIADLLDVPLEFVNEVLAQEQKR